jgi:hypothetical protein
MPDQKFDFLFLFYAFVFAMAIPIACGILPYPAKARTQTLIPKEKKDQWYAINTGFYVTFISGILLVILGVFIIPIVPYLITTDLNKKAFFCILWVLSLSFLSLLYSLKHHDFQLTTLYSPEDMTDFS